MLVCGDGNDKNYAVYVEKGKEAYAYYFFYTDAYYWRFRSFSLSSDGKTLKTLDCRQHKQNGDVSIYLNNVLLPKYIAVF